MKLLTQEELKEIAKKFRDTNDFRLLIDVPREQHIDYYNRREL